MEHPAGIHVGGVPGGDLSRQITEARTIRNQYLNGSRIVRVTPLPFEQNLIIGTQDRNELLSPSKLTPATTVVKITSATGAAWLSGTGAGRAASGS